MSKLFSSFPGSLFCHGNALRDSFGGMNEGMRVYKTEGPDSGKGALDQPPSLDQPPLVEERGGVMKRLLVAGRRSVLAAALALGLGSTVACNDDDTTDLAEDGSPEEDGDTTGETGGEMGTEETGSDGTTEDTGSGDTTDSSSTDSGTDTSGDTTDSGTDTGMTPEMWFKDAHVDCSKTVEEEVTMTGCLNGKRYYFSFEGGPGIAYCEQPVVEFVVPEYNQKEGWIPGTCEPEVVLSNPEGKRIFQGILEIGNVGDVNIKVTIPCFDEGGENPVEVSIVQAIGIPA